MAEYPFFPLATDAYLSDTHHLTTIEHGCYLLLLIAMWRNRGFLPNDDRQLAKFAHLNVQQWNRMKPTIMAFFKINGDTLSQGRLSDELAYIREHSKKQSTKARTRWAVEQTPHPPVKQVPTPLFNASQANPLETLKAGSAVAMPDACRSDAPTPTPTPTLTIEEPKGSLSETPVSDAPQPRKRCREYPLDFETVWKAYPTRINNSKSQALVEWRKLTPDEREMVLPSLSGFAGYCKANPDYKPIHLERYLKFRRFEGFLAPHQGSDDGQGTDWQTRLAFGRTHQTWSTARWGPAPGQPGCLVPENLLVDGDGADWIEWTGLQAVGSN